MADSQNTYRNDVKIKSENTFGNWIIGIFVAAIIAFGGYFVYDSEMTKAYDEGYDTGYEDGEDEGYDEGYDKGKSDGYKNGYADAKEKYEKTSSSSNQNTSNKASGNSSTSSNNYSSSNNEKEYSYVLNKNTKKFHYSSCYSVKQMENSNKRFYNGTRTEVIEMGYSPCGNCHP